MKKLSIILLLFIAMSGCNAKEQDKLKRYDVKSGIVKYVTTISGKVMSSTIQGSGIENLYFKDWGLVELKEEKSSQTTTTKLFGKKSVDESNTHTIHKLDNGESYIVDFDNQKIMVSKDMTMEMTKAFYPNADAGDLGENALESMGGSKIGIESILGYSCDVWEISGGKQWLYKGVMLKLEMTVFGITTITKANTADFDTSISDKHFDLPDFPIDHQDNGLFDVDEFDGEMDEMDMEELDASMEKLSKMSYEEWKKIALADKEDDEIQNMSEAELRETYNMIQKVVKMNLTK